MYRCFKTNTVHVHATCYWHRLPICKCLDVVLYALYILTWIQLNFVVVVIFWNFYLCWRFSLYKFNCFDLIYFFDWFIIKDSKLLEWWIKLVSSDESECGECFCDILPCYYRRLTIQKVEWIPFQEVTESGTKLIKYCLVLCLRPYEYETSTTQPCSGQRCNTGLREASEIIERRP